MARRAGCYQHSEDTSTWRPSFPAPRPRHALRRASLALLCHQFSSSRLGLHAGGVAACAAERCAAAVPRAPLTCAGARLLPAEAATHGALTGVRVQATRTSLALPQGSRQGCAGSAPHLKFQKLPALVHSGRTT